MNKTTKEVSEVSAFLSASMAHYGTKTQTVLNILTVAALQVADSLGIEPAKDDIKDGKDVAVKRALTETLGEYWKAQAIECKELILALPEDMWSENGTANLQVITAKQSEEGEVTMAAGALFKKIRAAFQFAVDTQGREIAFELLAAAREANDASTLRAPHDAFREAQAEASDTSPDDGSPDDGGGSEAESLVSDSVVITDNRIKESIEELLSAVSGKVFTDDQARAIVAQVETLTGHIHSVTAGQEKTGSSEGGEQVQAPVVKKVEAKKKSASK